VVKSLASFHKNIQQGKGYKIHYIILRIGIRSYTNVENKGISFGIECGGNMFGDYCLVK
jgi:hypothetical protein